MKNFFNSQPTSNASKNNQRQRIAEQKFRGVSFETRRHAKTRLSLTWRVVEAQPTRKTMRAFVVS